MRTIDQIESGIFSEQDRLGGRKKLMDYIDTVFRFLDKLELYRIYTVSKLVKHSENIELLTNIILIYIHSNPNEGLVFLRDDLTQFRKYPKID